MTWLVRLLLALALLFSVEILLWHMPSERALWDWPLLLAGYMALSALVLDVWARWRVRDVFGLLVLAGGFSLLMSLTLNSEAAFADMPRTLVTRVMGIYTAAGLLALLLVAALLAGQARRLLPGAPLIGLLWGVWGRWLPVITGAPAGPELVLMLAYGGGTLALIALAAWLNQRVTITADALILPRLGWLLSILVLTLLALRAPPEPLYLIMVLLLAAYNALILWFQAPVRGAARLHLPPAGLNPLALSAALLLFLLAGIGGYNLPLDSDSQWLSLPLGIFGAFGLVWLPAVSVVLGVRGYRRQSRQRHL